ncbi:MAG: RNA polymerase sigma factor [Myxococcota bacterium]|nr:RNA polymerase sigma factor [Myxococcota bacterium]
MSGTDTRDVTGGWGDAEAAADADDLVWRLRAGERSALAEVYDRHRDHVRRFAQRLVADAAAAEDLVQDVFLALPKAIGRFEGRGTLRAFLISIALNHCRHHVRAAARRRAASERMARMSAPDPAATPSDCSQRRELADAMARALDRLPLDQRIAFVLSVIEERSSQEVSALIGAPEATVRTRVLRARRKLQAHLEREGVR